MTPTLPTEYRIMATPSRDEYRPYREAHIPFAKVIMDTDGNAMHTFVALLRSVGESPALIMEDDVLVCHDFKRRVDAEIARRPQDIIQFFSRRKKDLEVGSRWIPMASFSFNICFYLPQGYCKRLLQYYDRGWRRIAEHPTGYDLMLGDCFAGENYWNVVPNLVDHRVGKSSIDSRRAKSRVSLTAKDIIQP